MASTRFNGTHFRPGYRTDDVDNFVERIIVTLEVLEDGGSMPDPVTPEEAASVTFRRTSFSSGYEIPDVDAFVTEVVATLSAAPPVVPSAPGIEGSRRRTSPRGLAVVLRDLVVGQRPEHPPTKAPRVPRVPGRYVHVDTVGVHWRTWTRRSGIVVASDVRSIEVLEVTYVNLRGPDILRRYALVLDGSGAALLRVGLGCWGRQWRNVAEFQTWLRGVWEPLGMPVTRWNSTLGRAKDARLRWPEAFSFAHAYPYWTGFVVLGVYCTTVAIFGE